MNARLTKTEGEALETVINRLHALTDVFNKQCGVKDEHKEGVRIYVESWIIPQLEALNLSASQRDYSDTSLLKFTAGDVYTTRSARQEAAVQRAANA